MGAERRRKKEKYTIEGGVKNWAAVTIAKVKDYTIVRLQKHSQSLRTKLGNCMLRQTAQLKCFISHSLDSPF